jgi:hypothetical protein
MAELKQALLSRRAAGMHGVPSESGAALTMRGSF